MDGSKVREAAEAHARATVAGDLKTAGSYLDPGAYGAAGAVMKSMPDPLEACEVTDVDGSGESFDVKIAYSGGGSTATVLSTWSDVGGDPKIVGLRVL